MKNPWLSVLMPTYNGEKCLSFALDSIVDQNDQDIECIVVDDGSTDSTLSILKKYQSQLQLRVLKRQEKNWVVNTNYALSLAKGNYTCFLHQDDLWLKNRLSTMRRIVGEFPQIGFFIHPSIFINEKNDYLGTWRCPLPKYPNITPSILLLERLLTQNFISIPGVIFKREIALNVQGLDERLWYTADWDLWLKISNYTNAIYFPRPLSGFRIHTNSQTILRSANANDFKNQLEQVVQKNIERLNYSKSQQKNIQKTSMFSIDVNVALAKLLHKGKVNYQSLMLSFARLGPLNWYRYFRDSRILERLIPRLKIKIKL